MSTCKVFYGKLTFIYLKMPKFHTREGNWRELLPSCQEYFLKNPSILHTFT